jgi:pSer/pThr/pTyr-binding forkhead associated (FHA) protein
MGHTDISRVHCEFYTIVFEESENYSPLIYVRDLQSENGTFVNGRLIGKYPDVRAGYLLENGDTVDIGANLRLCIRQFVPEQPKAKLSLIQQEEVKVCFF